MASRRKRAIAVDRFSSGFWLAAVAFSVWVVLTYGSTPSKMFVEVLVEAKALHPEGKSLRQAALLVGGGPQPVAPFRNNAVLQSAGAVPS